MNRTTLILGSAAALVVAAFLLGRPKSTETQAVSVTPPQPPVERPQPPSGLPTGSLTLSGALSHPTVMQGRSEVFAVYEIVGADIPGSARTPINAALVIDTSGSMANGKLNMAKRAALRFIELTQEKDRIAIVNYSNSADVLPGQFATPEHKQRMRQFISSAREAGGTNTEAGVRNGAEQLQLMSHDFASNRIVLLSDGQPTVGATSPAALMQLVAELHGKSLSVTALGFGQDVNEDLMNSLAQVGGGSYGFISQDDGATLAQVFEKDLNQASTLIGRNTSLNLTLAPGVECLEVYGRHFTTDGNEVVVAMNDFSARQREKVVVRLAVNAHQAPSLDIVNTHLRYQDVLAKGEAGSDVRLTARVSDNALQVAQHRNKDAFIESTRMRYGVNLKKAAEALAIGNAAEAQQVLRDNAGVFQDAKAIAGDAAMASEEQENEALFGLSAAPASTGQRQEQAKTVKAKALKRFGRGESVY
jgi:Ca-activated chloride channel homolog